MRYAESVGDEGETKSVHLHSWPENLVPAPAAWGLFFLCVFVPRRGSRAGGATDLMQMPNASKGKTKDKLPNPVRLTRESGHVSREKDSNWLEAICGEAMQGLGLLSV